MAGKETRPLETMADFFNKRAGGYDQYMRTFPSTNFDEFFQVAVDRWSLLRSRFRYLPWGVVPG